MLAKSSSFGLFRQRTLRGQVCSQPSDPGTAGKTNVRGSTETLEMLNPERQFVPHECQTDDPIT